MTSVQEQFLASSSYASALTSPSSSSLWIAQQEAWRQYVVLATCLFVLGDVVLGSPFMNSVMKPLQEASGIESSNSGSQGGGGLFSSILSTTDADSAESASKERVDSEKLAQEAIDRSKMLLENIAYMEKTKSDDDRMEEMKRSMDKKISSVDKALADRREQMELEGKW